jgi:hypothetical protein
LFKIVRNLKAAQAVVHFSNIVYLCDLVSSRQSGVVLNSLFVIRRGEVRKPTAVIREDVVPATRARTVCVVANLDVLAIEWPEGERIIEEEQLSFILHHHLRVDLSEAVIVGTANVGVDDPILQFEIVVVTTGRGVYMTDHGAPDATFEFFGRREFDGSNGVEGGAEEDPVAPALFISMMADDATCNNRCQLQWQSETQRWRGESHCHAELTADLGDLSRTVHSVPTSLRSRKLDLDSQGAETI